MYPTIVVCSGDLENLQNQSNIDETRECINQASSGTLKRFFILCREVHRELDTFLNKQILKLHSNTQKIKE